MSLQRANEMVDYLNTQPNASNGFSATKMYKTGMEFGLTCKEVKFYFLGKDVAISRGCYAATHLSQQTIDNATVAPKVVKTPKAKVVKTPKAKVVKTPKAKVVKVAAKKAAKVLLTEVVPPGTELIEDDENSSWEDGIAYIATPEEIAEEQ